MERSCLGDSCLVKCDGETMRQIQRERWNKRREGGEGNGVNSNKQHRRAEADRWDGAKSKWQTTCEQTQTHMVINTNKFKDTRGRRAMRRQRMGARTQKETQKYSTIAVHTHTHIYRGSFVRCCQLPRLCIGSCSGSFNTGTINRRKLVCPEPEPVLHTGATSFQLLLVSRAEEIVKLDYQKSAAPKQNLHSGPEHYIKK